MSPSGFTILTPAEQEFKPPSWRPEEPMRRIVELPLHANMRYSRAHLWRYPPGATGRLHVEHSQEEVFVVLTGTLTMLLGDPPERVDVGPHSVVAVEPMTPLQIRNESDEELILFIYGAPPEQAGADFFGDVEPPVR